MGREKILVVDDEDDILELLDYNLKKNGYEVKGVASGEQALKSVKQEVPDLVVLDLMLPGIDGLDVCKVLKNDDKTSNVPILMLTAKGEEADVVTGLELGADDYVTKPFSPRVLMARAKALLRRKGGRQGADMEIIKTHDLLINPGRHEVKAGGENVELTYSEFKILHFLSKRPGWVFSREQIIEAVRGLDYPVTDRSVDVQIAGLRRKLGPYAELIETVRGVGYRFKE